MKAMTQSDLAKRYNVKSELNLDLSEVVKCTMKPRFCSEYTIECTGLIIIEKESGKTSVFVLYKFGNETRRMNWSQFKASEKIKIQNAIIQ